MAKTLLVTGGAGFIGANFVHLAAAKDPALKVLVVDKLTYAGNPINIEGPLKAGRAELVEADICDQAAMEAALVKHRPYAIVNFAAESHVDRSIDGPKAFIDTNYGGVFSLLEAVRKHIKELPADFRFLQVSTDEVYGSLGPEGLFSEETPYAPNSPYSASKAGADFLVRAYFHTYGLPGLITNCSNNYGPYQFPEKLIPLMILNALEGKNLPVYGDGGNIRDWLHVEDHCEGIWAALHKGRLGEKYNIGGSNERNNLQVVKRLCAELEKAKPAGKPYEGLIKFVTDRPGHDRRYAIDASKIKAELGWKPKYDFDSGIAQTVRWYVDNLGWCKKVQEGKYERQRLGTVK